MSDTARATLLRLCREEGFALAGAASLAPCGTSDEFREWIARGHHGEMAWLARTLEDRLDPARLLEGARSVVMVADFYGRRGEHADGKTGGGGRVARYARGRDYHDLIKRRLRRVCDRLGEDHPAARTRIFADTAPVHERDLAALCGLGWIGKHTLLIHPIHGSWMLLGGFLTTLELGSAHAPRAVTDHCGTCTRCIDACPTDAITPYSVDASRCLSYLTIEHRTAIAPELAASLGDWLIGCDICQEVCPHNSARPEPPRTAIPPEYAPRRTGFDPLGVLDWDEATRRARFASSALKRVSLAQLKRNAVAILEIRLRDAECDADERRRTLGRLADLAWDAREPELVRNSASEAIDRLGAS